ncbi:hypothetical protein FBU30_005062 [Linnemannia zychae]|nr:hypothetical protein FBU30_005062 [Linnemannia zychae]
MTSSIVVYGGSGALGRAIVSHFIKKQWSVTSVDFNANQEATNNILLNRGDSLEEQGQRVTSAVNEPVDAIICVAGGWAGGNAASKDLFANSELMWKQSVHSSLIASHLASKSLKAGGLLTLTGAYPAQKGTPFMIGYGMAKAAVHQLVASLAGPDSGLPADAKVNAILPITLDTPMNRAGMPGADFSSWTPCSEVAETLFGWASKATPFTSGKLVEIVTKNNVTTYTENNLMTPSSERDNAPESYHVDVLALSVPEYAMLLEKVHKFTILPTGLDTTAEKNMLATRVYDCDDPLLILGRQRSNEITTLYSSLSLSDFGAMYMDPGQRLQALEHKRQALLYLLTRGKIGSGCRVDPPIQVDYGHNMTLGSHVSWSTNGVALDCAVISIGDRTILGPGVKLFGATHPLNPLLRHPVRHFDFAMEIHIGKDCWLGGGVIVCPGVRIGDGVSVLPGSVVTKNVPDYVVVEGSPARIMNVLQNSKHENEERTLIEKDTDKTVDELLEEWTPPRIETMALP